MALNEIRSNEKPTTGAIGIYIWLPRHTCSSATYPDIILYFQLPHVFSGKEIELGSFLLIADKASR